VHHPPVTDCRAASDLLTRSRDRGDLVHAIEGYQTGEPTLGITGLHEFTLNQAATSTTWLQTTRSEEDQHDD
jgi:hypothetical protein